MKSCSFFGHRDVVCGEELKRKLRDIVEEKIINDNYTIFYFGGFGEFDDLCYKLVSELKSKYAHIKRIFCLTDQKYLIKRPKWLRAEDYEDFVYFDLQFEWWYKRIYYRNLEIINHSNFIVFFAKNNNESGAYKALQYAIKKKKDFINLAE